MQFMNTVRQERWRENIAPHARRHGLALSPDARPRPDPGAEFMERDPSFADKQKLLDWVDEVSLMQARDFWNNREAQRHLQRSRRRRASSRGRRTGRCSQRGSRSLVHKFDRKRITAVVIGGETAGTWRIFGLRYEGTYSVDDWR